MCSTKSAPITRFSCVSVTYSASPPTFGAPPPGDLFEAAWSEFAHDWAGLLLLAIGGLAIAERCGLPWGRRWPLLFLAFAIFLAVEADTAIRPLPDLGPSKDLAGTGDAQHRVVGWHTAKLGVNRTRSLWTSSRLR